MHKDNQRVNAKGRFYLETGFCSGSISFSSMAVQNILGIVLQQRLNTRAMNIICDKVHSMPMKMKNCPPFSEQDEKLIKLVEVSRSCHLQDYGKHPFCTWLNIIIFICTKAKASFPLLLFIPFVVDQNSGENHLTGNPITNMLVCKHFHISEYENANNRGNIENRDWGRMKVE